VVIGSFIKEVITKNSFPTNGFPTNQWFLPRDVVIGPRVAVDFALVSKTKQNNTAVATILITCVNNSQKKSIENGLHKNRNVIPDGLVTYIVVKKAAYASRFTSTPSNLGEYGGRRVEGLFVDNQSTMCGVLGRLHSFDGLSHSDLTLGGTIVADETVCILTTAHSMSIQ
jgi:hypothetical protein